MQYKIELTIIVDTAPEEDAEVFSITNGKGTISCHIPIDKEGGTSEALKLKLHLNSEVYKREIFNDFG